MLNLERVFKPSIYRRILGSFGIIIFSIIIVATVNYFQLTQFRILSAQAIPSSTQIAILQDYALALSAVSADLDSLFVIGGGEIEEKVRLDLINMEDSLDLIQENASSEHLPAIETLLQTTKILSAETLILIDLLSDRSDARRVNEQTISVFNQIDLAEQQHEALSEATLNQVQGIIFTQEDIATNMINQIIILAIVALLIAIFASLFVSRSIAVPLFEVVQIAQQISDGDLMSRAKVTGEDEIGQLATSFNAMADTIQAREKDLVNLNQSLEERVADRTIKLEQARDEALAAQRLAKENDRLKSEFLSTMSHELRTPLNAIEGFTSIMLSGMGIELSERAEDMVKRVSSNSKRLLHLINDFLDLSRIESGRLELIKAPIYPESLARKWESEVGILAEEKNIDFIITVSPDLPSMLLSDEDALSKIVINLLSNAFKFTHQGHVTLEMGRLNDGWSISVTDTGIGIPTHARDYIFDEFRQVDGSSKRLYGGTGLGLALVQKLARAMGGNVMVDSEFGKGSTFTVSLPIEVVEEKQQGVLE